MPFTKTEIENALLNFVAKQSKCEKDTPRIVCTLLQRCCKLQHAEKCTSFEEFLDAINNEFPEFGLVPFWPMDGYVGSETVKHGYVVYSINPLCSFTAFDGCGNLKFLNADETKDKVENTFILEKEGRRYVDVNKIEGL
jgi:hypothetical protein